MGKSHFKKAIVSLENRIAEHQEKIKLELTDLPHSSRKSKNTTKDVRNKDEVE